MDASDSDEETKRAPICNRFTLTDVESGEGK
jgi:hypothetical protein